MNTIIDLLSTRYNEFLIKNIEDQVNVIEVMAIMLDYTFDNICNSNKIQILFFDKENACKIEIRFSDEKMRIFCFDETKRNSVDQFHPGMKISVEKGWEIIQKLL
ncbi:hypothetical protein D3C87_80800 [compost metagenome]